MKYIKEIGIKEHEIIAQIKVESNFNECAVSEKGACGLMQLLPRTAKMISPNEMPEYIFDIDKNIKCGILHLEHLAKRTRDKKKTFLKYFWGETKIKNQYYYWDIIREARRIKVNGEKD